MADTDHRRRIRIFLSSPEDVAEERRLAAELIDRKLRKDPGIVSSCVLELVRWDDPDVPTPLDAIRVPQGSVNWTKGKPSECDIVVVVLWSRLGSPFELDGERWASGTQWEYEDAKSAASPPNVLVYRRTATPQIDLDAADYELRSAQYQAAKAFLAVITASNSYSTIEEFVALLETHLRGLIAKLSAPKPQASFKSSLLDRFGIASLAPPDFRAGAEAFIQSYQSVDEVGFG